jgi:hypothetical protein
LCACLLFNQSSAYSQVERFPDEVSTLIFALNIFTGGKTLENINHLEIQLTPKDAEGKGLHFGGTSSAAFTLESVFKLGMPFFLVSFFLLLFINIGRRFLD